MKAAQVAEILRKTDLDIAMDDFTGKSINRKRALIGNTWIEAGSLADYFFPAIQVYLERTFDGMFPPNKVREALDIIAVENQFSEPAETFDGYERSWDGVKRLDKLGTVFFGNPAADEAIKTMIMYMVAGAYGYTVDWQYTIDFIGRQGTGKTQFLKRIGGKYYTDQITSFRDKDSLEVMSGSLLVNDDEMLVSSGKSAIEFKKFVSSTKMTYRASYGHVSMDHRRRFVIARTTNDFGYIKDLTGNRRIVPVIVNEKNRERHPATITNIEASKIVGEAVHKFDWDKLQADARRFDKSIGTTMAETINELTSDGEFVDKIREYVERQTDSFTKKDVFLFMTSNDPTLLESGSSRFINRKIVDSLSAIGYREKVVKVNGKSKRVMVNDDESLNEADEAEIFERLLKK
ncbi:VapE family protein [Leuconostoc falkenbergense]|uniref:VapE domain-containing protein n=1 Tax=Leuconostoc falkenbergense TaxID=2766470 RepID=UPI002A7F16E5|nr:VapE domain-containing protein [Leuconostoc falkenbergense]MDY5164548.1 VapE family protein [Leuconostoc falkenbergense]